MRAYGYLLDFCLRTNRLDPQAVAAILADFETRIARREAEVLMRDEWAYPDTR